MLLHRVLLLIAALLAASSACVFAEVNVHFGEVIASVQHQNRNYVASKLGRIGSFWFTELKFEWSFLVPNPHADPADTLVTSLWYRSNLLVSTGKHAVYGWNAVDGTQVWAFEAPNRAEVLESVFFEDTTVVVSTSDRRVYELNKDTGAVKRTLEVDPLAKHWTVLLNEEDRSRDLVQSFQDGRITITTMGAVEPRKEFKAADSEFAVIQDDGYLVHKKDTNRAVFIHVNSGGNLPVYYYGENIINLHSDHPSQSIVFQGKKTKSHVVLRVVNDTVQEWKIGAGNRFTVHNPTNAAWVTNSQKPAVRYQGPEAQIPMPSETKMVFKRAWNVQGDRKTLLFTVSENNTLGFWRHIEGFNGLQKYWLLHQDGEAVTVDARSKDEL